jgi:hypothetical protein
MRTTEIKSKEKHIKIPTPAKKVLEKDLLEKLIKLEPTRASQTP